MSPMNDTMRRGGPGVFTMVTAGVLAYLASHPHTLGNLLDKFHQKGLGPTADSWVGTGPNAPVHPQDVHNVLDPQTIQDISRQTGLSPQETTERLAQVLPNVVDKLTPHGQVPEPGVLQQGISFLKNSLGLQPGSRHW
jgi:uncharacterized protein YidB (DUF937 family)